MPKTISFSVMKTPAQIAAISIT